MFLDQVAGYRHGKLPRAARNFTRPPRPAQILLALFLLINLSAPSFAQQNPADADEVVRVRTDLVTVPALVTDSQGRPVPGLTLKDFDVRSDGRAAEIAYFAAGTERVALCFALDTSGSVREQITRQRQAARSLFERFGPSSSVAVLSFDERSHLVVPFTEDAASILPAFQLAAVPNRRTAIFNAAADAVRLFSARRGHPAERRIVILISDGLDTTSTESPAAVIEAARAAGLSFYVIHLPFYAPRDGRLEPRPAAKGFRDLAQKTGGRYFLVGDARASLDPQSQADLAPVFQAIEEDLRGQYVLGFYPGESERDGRFHTLAVTLTPERRSRKLRVNTLRAGYILKKQNTEATAQKPE